MEVSEEKLNEIADLIKSTRAFWYEGKIQIREKTEGDLNKLKENIDIIRNNFAFFCSRGSSIMYPDEFINLISSLPDGNQILADNFFMAMKKLSGMKKSYAYGALSGIPKIADTVEANFDEVFEHLIGRKPEDLRNEPKLSSEEKSKLKHEGFIASTNESGIRYLINFLSASPRLSEILEEHKDLFFNKSMCGAMYPMAEHLAKIPGGHEFLRNNFDKFLEWCPSKDIAKLYLSVEDIAPDEYEKVSFIMDKIYKPALETLDPHSFLSHFGIEQTNSTCSRIIEQGRSKDLEELINFMTENSETEKGTFKVLRCWKFKHYNKSRRKSFKNWWKYEGSN